MIFLHLQVAVDPTIYGEVLSQRICSKICIYIYVCILQEERQGKERIKERMGEK